MEVRTVKRVLTHEFNQHEKEELGKELANKNLQLAGEEASKRSVVASYASQISATKEGIANLSNKLASGYELKETVCEVEYHTPERNIKQLRRTDTGETWTEPMTDVDFDLWTQFNEVPENAGGDAGGDTGGVNTENADEDSEEEEFDDAYED
ncbi:MAG: hypothetical protein LBK58_08700 [Prevotellaceae bacterium]|jgi:hypothetical protein|nr:hypothetical protein [Prevotellaceae bacterium]